jgi:hypothetical protein
MESIRQYVKQRLKLKVNRQKSVVDLAKKRFLLGFGFFGRDGEIKVRVNPKSLKRAKDRLRELTSRKWSVSMERRIEEINRFTVGWTAYFGLAETPSPFERPTSGSDGDYGRSAGRNGSTCAASCAN